MVLFDLVRRTSRAPSCMLLCRMSEAFGIVGSRRLTVVFLALSSLLAALPAGAQPGNRAAAEALFNDGRRAMERKDFAEACAKFEASNQLDPAVGTVFNLANCNEQRGRLASAWQLYREVNDKLPVGDERAAVAQKRAEELEARLPRLTLKLKEGTPSGTHVVFDGTLLPDAMLGTAVPVDPGPHKAVVRAPGRSDRTFDVSLAEAETTTLMVEAAPSAGGATTGRQEPPTSSRDLVAAPRSGASTLGYVIAGVGVASLGASVVTGLLALSKSHTVDDHCTPTPTGSGRYCDGEGLSAADSGKPLAIVSDVTLAAGVVGVGVGAFLIFSAKPSERTAVSLAPIPGGGLMDVRGAF